MITEAIRNRKSVRTFEKQPLSSEQLDQIRSWIDSIQTPFGVPVHFELLNKEENGFTSPVLAGEEWYVAGKVPRVDNAEEAYGYALEDFILKAQEMGLGTVWLAATINRKQFEKVLNVTEEEVLPAVTPVGYPAKKRSMKESLMRKGMKADSRKPFNTLFFENNFSTPLEEEKAGIWKLPLEMVRLAPSATNKQPWRVIIHDGKAEFYEKKTPGYAQKGTGDIQKVDLGIAMRHFDLTCDEQGHKGSWSFHDPEIEHPSDLEYIATWTME